VAELAFVRSMRRALPVSALVVTLCVASCTAPTVVAPRAQPHAGDPALAGAADLLSAADFRAALAVARRRLAVLAPHCNISEVDVISAVRVEAWFCRNDSSHQDWRGMLVLEKRNGLWTVVREQGGRPDSNERVII
jgi:hypothetical protein